MTNASPIRPRWSMTLKDERRVGARTPVIADNRIYQVFHYEKGSGYESTLLALDLESGTELWRSIIGHVATDPVVGAGGVVYVSSFGGSVYALEPGGTVMWTAPTAERNMGVPCLAGRDRVLVAETGGRSRRTWCMDAASGEVVWSFDNGGHSYAIATTPDVAVHATAVNTEAFGEAAPTLYALAVKDGGVLWSATHDQYLFGPAIVGEHVVIGARGSVRAYAMANGKLAASLALPGETAAQSVHATSAGLVVIDDTNRLRLLSLRKKRGLFGSSVDLAEIWVTQVSAETAGRPIEFDAGIAILTTDGAVHMMEAASGRIAHTLQGKRGFEGTGGLAHASRYLAVASGRSLQVLDATALSSKEE